MATYVHTPIGKLLYALLRHITELALQSLNRVQQQSDHARHVALVIECTTTCRNMQESSINVRHVNPRLQTVRKTQA
jgi:hypothetical protein